MKHLKQDLKTGPLSVSPRSNSEHKNFRLLFHAFLVGLTAGVVGSAFRLALTYIEVFRDHLYTSAGNSGLISWLWPVLFASTVRAPLTGLVLAVEMTSNFELILPLIITTVSASVVTAWLGNKPIYTTLLERTLAIKKSV